MATPTKQPRWQDILYAPPPEPEVELVGFSARLQALLIDYIMILLGAVVLVGVGSLLSPYLEANALILTALGGMLLVYFFNNVALSMLTGQSIGKMVLGIRVSDAYGRPVKWYQLLGRYTVGYALSSIVLGLGFLHVIWDSEQQAWHDKLFGTYVVRTIERC